MRLTNPKTIIKGICPYLVIDRWHKLPFWLRWWVGWKVFSGRIKVTPVPIKFAMTASIACFITLAILPLEPISLAAAYGTGLVSALLIHRG